MRRFLLGGLCAAWLWSGSVQAMTGVIYQPQTRDQSVSADRWQQLMQTLRAQGFDTLVLQWSAYGKALTDADSRRALQARAQAARQAGLKLVIGLYADPDFFTRQAQPPDARKMYLYRLLAEDIKLARQWQASRLPIDGWYISAEIDDLHWRDDAACASLTDWLIRTRKQLSQLAAKPISISSFFAGNMTPTGYRQLVQTMAATGIRVWVQDGAGVGKLSPAARQLYLDQAVFDASAPAAGIVWEVFRQRSAPNAPFQAQPLTDAEFKQVWDTQQRTAPGKDHLFFSLRYLPAARGVLPSP